MSEHCILIPTSKNQCVCIYIHIYAYMYQIHGPQTARVKGTFRPKCMISDDMNPSERRVGMLSSRPFRDHASFVPSRSQRVRTAWHVCGRMAESWRMTFSVISAKGSTPVLSQPPPSSWWHLEVLPLEEVPEPRRSKWPKVAVVFKLCTKDPKYPNTEWLLFLR